MDSMPSCMFISLLLVLVLLPAPRLGRLGICPGWIVRLTRLSGSAGAGTCSRPVGREVVVLAAESLPRLIELLIHRLALLGREGIAEVLPQDLEEFSPALHALTRIE